MIVDIRARGLFMENLIDLDQDLSPEDDLKEGYIVGVIPDLNWESWESCDFNSDFLELDLLTEIVQNHGKTLF